MAYETASGESTLFSQSNVDEVRIGIKRKVREWWNKHVMNDDNSINEMWENLILAKAFTPASCDEGTYTSTEKDNSLFGNSACGLINEVQRQANRIVAGMIFDLDICNPNQEKLEELKKQLFENGNNKCEDLLRSKITCDALKNNDLQTAYEKCYYYGNLHENNPKELPEPPIDCGNGTETETNDDEFEETFNGDEEELNELEEENNEENGSQETGDFDPHEGCLISFYPDNLLGFDFEVTNCERTHDEILECFIMCGEIPPLYLFEEELCYETIDGYVNYDEILMCHERPMPPPHAEECISHCATEMN
jgi:hypothetical protein